MMVWRVSAALVGACLLTVVAGCGGGANAAAPTEVVVDVRGVDLPRKATVLTAE
jgi:hypothetical protein